jgi:hypothetical protein
VLVLRKQILNKQTNNRHATRIRQCHFTQTQFEKKKNLSTTESHQALIRHAHKIAGRRKTTKNKRDIRTENVRWQNGNFGKKYVYIKIHDTDCTNSRRKVQKGKA